MTKYATLNPLGSMSPYDLFDNAQNLDFAVNSYTATTWQDRFNKTRLSWYGIEQMAREAIAAFGYITMDSFQAGATLTLPNQVLRDTSTGEYYRWDGVFPKTVPAGSTPASTGGISLGAWLSVGDATLRSNLVNKSDESLGDALLGVKQPFADAVARTQHDFNAQFVTVFDANAKGDGVANDTAAFALFETWKSGQIVDLHGKTYLVDAIPLGNRYSNGYWIVGGKTYAPWYQPSKQWGEIFVFGADALSQFGPASTSSQTLFVVGKNAAKNAVSAQGGVILGQDAHKETLHIPYGTIAIGRGVLQLVQPASSDLAEIYGNRNIGIGAYALRFLTTGYQNVVGGRNAGSGLTTSYQCTLLGTGATSGEAPVGLTGEIVNIQDMTGFRTCSFGYNAGKNAIEATDSVFVGARTGQSVKKGTFNTFVGAATGINIGNDTAINGNLYKSTATISATYSQAANTITITTSSAHGAAVGDTVQLAFTSGLIATGYTTDLVYAQVLTAPTTTSLTIQSPVSLTTSGAVNLRGVIGQVAGVANGNNTLGGYASCGAMVQAGGVTSWGYRSAENLTSSTYGTFIGRYAGASQLGGVANTVFGDNVTAIGNLAPLTANNQVQLGNSDTTVMYYQMQQRSDERDKAEVRDTKLGLDFIRGLRFVDYKWDLREDYCEIVEHQIPETYEEIQDYETGETDKEGNPVIAFRKVKVDGYRTETEYVSLPKDGSKKRTRWHHGLIAQELGQALQSCGIDSGIWQNHEVNGGADVQSASYVELIAPIGRSVQELDDEVSNLKLQLKSVLDILDQLQKKTG